MLLLHSRPLLLLKTSTCRRCLQISRSVCCWSMHFYSCPNHPISNFCWCLGSMLSDNGLSCLINKIRRKYRRLFLVNIKLSRLQYDKILLLHFRYSLGKRIYRSHDHLYHSQRLHNVVLFSRSRSIANPPYC